MRIATVDDTTFVGYAKAADVLLPIEQSPAWDAFDRVVPGRAPWRRLAVYAQEQDEQPTALLALTKYQGRGFTYLWGRHAPVWLTKAPDGQEVPTPEQEAALRTALVTYLRKEAPQETFVRLHAWHAAPELEPLLQTITYDRTVMVDLTKSEDERMAELSRSTRKKLRKCLADDAVVITDETEAARADFAEFYAILEETADRDAFGVYPMSVYQEMVRALAGHARVFVARRTDTGADGSLQPGRAVSWLMSIVSDTHGLNFYSGQTAEGRATNIGVHLRWQVFNELAASGIETYDLMGVDSDLAPSLKGVGEFKRQFGPEVAVDPAWDLPLKPLRYRALRLALGIKRRLR